MANGLHTTIDGQLKERDIRQIPDNVHAGHARLIVFIDARELLNRTTRKLKMNPVGVLF
jgi:ERCC4-type nuclease